MTAFLTVDRRWARAAPAVSREPLDRADVARAALVARWSVAADGRLACRWLVDDPGPDRPPR